MRVTPNRLTKKQIDYLMAPIRTAIIAFRLGRADSDHYHNLAAQIMIAHRIAELVQRHRHVLLELKAGMSALDSMFDRWKQRTIQDAFISGTGEEIDALDVAAEIYAALLKTTPYKTVRRAIRNVNDAVDKARGKSNEHTQH